MMIEIDGSQGEGGGQILRTALALAIVTGQALRLTRIRARRPKPGLMRQHLACVQAAQAISGAEVEGAELGATELRFAPGPVRAGDYDFRIASAGSCLLVLQTVLPPLLLADAPSTLHLQGGTHNPMAPSFHFVRDAFAPLLARMGGALALDLQRAGFYPAGGGALTATLTPGGPLRALDVCERGTLQHAQAECLAPTLPRNIAFRELETVAKLTGWPQAQLITAPAQTGEGPGNALIGTLRYEHVTEVFTSLGERGVPAETVAQRLVKQMRRYQAHTAALGPHLADQWALLQALAVWQSGQDARFTCTEATEHLRTNCTVIERFLPLRFTLDGSNAAAGTQVTVTRR